MDKKKDKKGQAKFGCELCDYFTSHKTKYEKHLVTMKHERIILDTKKGQKGEEKVEIQYICESCDYFTSHKTKYERHILTAKHKRTKKDQKETKKDQKGQLGESKNICVCGNSYVFQSGLIKHRKKCNFLNKDNLLLKCIESNAALQKTNEVVASATNALVDTSKIIHNIYDCLQARPMHIQNIQTQKIQNIQSQKIQKIDKNFNIQVFLNEDCKNAISISSFIDSIKPTLEDLENVGEKGYVKGISNIILSKLKEFDVYTRPIHNVKKQIYLKEKDWETDNKKVAKFVKNVAIKNMGNMSEWRKKYPDHDNLESPKNMQYLKLVQECIGGEDENKNTDKIIQNISKEIIV